MLFFVVASLQEIDPMYMFSLQYFNSIFNKTISSAPQSDILVKRLNILLVSHDVYLNQFYEALLNKLNLKI